MRWVDWHLQPGGRRAAGRKLRPAAGGVQDEHAHFRFVLALVSSTLPLDAKKRRGHG